MVIKTENGDEMLGKMVISWENGNEIGKMGDFMGSGQIITTEPCSPSLESWFIRGESSQNCLISD